MKRTMEKDKSSQQSQGGRTQKPLCGTLAYRAECRGMMKKTQVLRSSPPSENSRTAKRYSAGS